MTNFVDKVEALKKKAEKVIEPATPADAMESFYAFRRAASPDFILELCDKSLEAERLLREMTADRDLWQQAHDEDCPNKALVETLEAEIARLKGDR